MSETSPTSPEPPRPASARRRLLRRLSPLWRRGPETGEPAEGAATPDARGDALQTAQRAMMLNVSRFNGLRISDVMTPRADIIAIEAGATLSETAGVFAESQHSRLPVYRDTLDDPLGFVHVKDVMALLAPGADGAPKAKPNDRILARVKREIVFVPASMRLATLLVKMQSSRSHLALVVDEYGGTDGLVTIEDIVEQIVGEIADEHDVDDAELIVSRGGALEVDGRAGVEALERRLGASLALPEEDAAEYDTVAGLAAALLGRLPQRGEVVRHPAGFDFEVIDADPRRVKRLRIKTGAATGAGEPTT